MSFNHNKLRGKIIEKYGTQGAFAKALGVSERTLSLKINGKMDKIACNHRQGDKDRVVTDISGIHFCFPSFVI